jgi:hypothetical protein
MLDILYTTKGNKKDVGYFVPLRNSRISFVNDSIYSMIGSHKSGSFSSRFNKDYNTIDYV